MEPVADALGAVLARRIVERSMHRLGHNVNVMDSAGVIIGSGDGSRLGQVHEGALLAISRGRTVVVDAAMAERVVGVRPGINVPLVVEGRTVGAVGVTGDPERLREAADLLRMAAELMIEQAGALDDEQWRSSRCTSGTRAPGRRAALDSSSARLSTPGRDGAWWASAAARRTTGGGLAGGARRRAEDR